MAGQGLTMRSAKADCGPRPAEPTPAEPGWCRWRGRGVRSAFPADINLERYVVRQLVVRDP